MFFLNTSERREAPIPRKQKELGESDPFVFGEPLDMFSADAKSILWSFARFQPQPQQRKHKHNMQPNKDHNIKNSCWRAPPPPPPPPPPPGPPPPPPPPHLTPNNQLPRKIWTIRSLNPHWPHYSPHPLRSPPVIFAEPRTGTWAFNQLLTTVQALAPKFRCHIQRPGDCGHGRIWRTFGWWFVAYFVCISRNSC